MINVADLPVLLRAEPATLHDWLERQRLSRAAFCVIAIVLGAGIYGAVMGCWRSPLQALFTGIKLPLLILLTTLGNALLNAMLAPLLGLSWVLRPFIWDPVRPVEFLGPEYFHGSFYETVFEAARRLIFG